MESMKRGLTVSVTRNLINSQKLKKKSGVQGSSKRRKISNITVDQNGMLALQLRKTGVFVNL